MDRHLRLTSAFTLLTSTHGWQEVARNESASRPGPNCLPTRGTRNRGLGQLAGNKLALQVCCCSAGLGVILEAPPAVLQQWEDMDEGQGKQAGASHAPGRLHLLALYDPAPLCSAQHVVPSPICQPSQITHDDDGTPPIGNKPPQIHI